MIKTFIDRDLHLATHACTGKLTFKAIVEEIRRYFDEEPTFHSLWDLSDADLSEMDPDQLKGVADFTKGYAPDSVRGKTALVSSKDHSFGYSRMYSVFSEMAGVNVDIQVFRSLEDALEWIKHDDSAG